MDNSVESHIPINCFHAEYFGFAETARTDNISPNFVDDLVNKFLSINSSHKKSQRRFSITLVLPEFCPRTPVDTGLNSLSAGNGSCIQFRRVNDWTDHLKPFIPLRVFLKIERTSIEICAIEPSVTILSRPLCEVISCSQVGLEPFRNVINLLFMQFCFWKLINIAGHSRATHCTLVIKVAWHNAYHKIALNFIFLTSLMMKCECLFFSMKIISKL